MYNRPMSYAIRRATGVDDGQQSEGDAPRGRWQRWAVTLAAPVWSALVACATTSGPAGPAPPTPRAGCERASFEGRIYALCRDRKVPFPEARKDCEAMGMQLIRIDSAAEDAWIYRTFYEKPATPGPDGAQMWVGATDAGDEGQWRWLVGGDVFWRGEADGSQVGGLYSNWGRAHGLGAQNQPNDARSQAGEDCMVIRAPGENEGGHWTDIDCGNENDPPVAAARLGWYTCEAP